MNKQKSRRINRKQIKRKQNKKIAYNQKKMHGGKFNPVEVNVLKQSLERFNFDDEELNEVIEKLGSGAHHCWKDKLEQLIYQIDGMPNKEVFLDWLTSFYCTVFAVDDGTDSEYEDEDEDEDEEEWLATNHDEDED